jgi:ferredoxin-NADP reductase
MGPYFCRLTKREEVSYETMAFHFERPTDLQFEAGQYVDMTLIDPPETDSEGDTRSFSVASAPFEEELLFATRMRDTAFKRVLRSCPLGTEVEIAGPMGYFTLHNNAEKPAVFLAGGIGITPFLSIVRRAAKDRLLHHLYLFYSNRRPEDAAFMDDLRDLEAANPNYRLIPTMAEMEKSHREWKGETGFINREMLTRYLPDLQGPIYYIAGPPAMVAAMHQMLAAAGVDKDNIRAEEFAGY